MKRLFKSLKLFLAVALVVALVTTLVSGCGSTALSESYPLESVTQNGAESSRVYRSENKTVPQMAQELAEQRKPQEISKEDSERMFLIYSDELYHLQRDSQKPSDTLIEVDSKEFVRQNYNPSFLEGYMLASLVNNLFDTNKRYAGNYRGYSSKDTHKPNVAYRTPTPEEKKAIPPLTVQKSGSLIKRSNTPSVGGGPSVGANGNIITKETETQKIKSSTLTTPRNNSPPKTKVGGSGKITKRR